MEYDKHVYVWEYVRSGDKLVSILFVVNLKIEGQIRFLNLIWL